MTQDYYRSSRMLADKCIKVRNFIRYNPKCTNENIATGLGMKIQTVTPRTKELKENGIIWIVGKGKTSSNRSAWLYSIASCPKCKSNSLSVTKMDAVRFAYHCNNCNHNFIATVGSDRTQEVLVE